ncbi:hypothetical protein [uncultured Thiodictyon sp.]|uniref:hypothetical protein n=1 Tax=uncultured Thiodictyon sp. TaxID=1846217 RepID=UPI0025EE7BAD|nr:hypothetical protein [uncultured Thiodictyon sp.]
MFVNRKLSLGLGLLSVILATETASAAPAAVSVAGKTSVTFVVNGLANAIGFGGHFSTGSNENGYGGTYAECHFVAGTVAAPSGNLTLVCYDGYESPTAHTNMFRLELGPKVENGKPAISHATFTVSNRGVQVDVTRIATNVYTAETKPYTITSFFPLRESTGFFATGTIYYDNDGNGVLNNDSSRQGTGYSVAIPIVR